MAKTSTYGQTLRLILAQNVRTYRAKTKISQEGLAARCGLHRTDIGSIERARKKRNFKYIGGHGGRLGRICGQFTHEPSNDNE